MDERKEELIKMYTWNINLFISGKRNGIDNLEDAENQFNYIKKEINIIKDKYFYFDSDINNLDNKEKLYKIFFLWNYWAVIVK